MSRLAFAVALALAAPAAAADMLLLQDNEPYGSDYWVELLADEGLIPQYADGDQLGALSLSDYDLIVIPSQQPSDFNATINGASATLAQYVEGGGALAMMLVTWSVYETHITNLPFGASATVDTAAQTTINAAPGHPLMAGLPAGGYGRSGGALAGFGDATVLTSNEIGQDTSYLLHVGCGSLLVSHLPLEYLDWNGPNLWAPIGDNAVPYLLSWMPDGDGDGYGDPDCGGDDCDDADAALNHDDADGDGVSSCDGDCDDAEPAAAPGLDEICDDGIDNDCDGLIDGDDGDCADGDDHASGDDDASGPDDVPGEGGAIGGGDCACRQSPTPIRGALVWVVLLGVVGWWRWRFLAANRSGTRSRRAR